MKKYVACPGVVSHGVDGVELDEAIRWHLSVWSADEAKVSISIHDKEAAFLLAIDILNQLRDKKDVVEVEVHGRVKPALYETDWMFEQLTEEEAAEVHRRIQEDTDVR